MQFLGAFVANIGINCAFMAEIMAAIIAVEKTISVNWLWIWLETDSKLLVHAYKPLEGNVCASKLASFAAYNLGYRWWDSPTIFISQKLLWC
uniref:RNase H type-1 domain-containing protein n=1 Tax=Glycine max TaxID=3847 RepID=A0A0R0FSG4_SOYBN